MEVIFLPSLPFLSLSALAQSVTNVSVPFINISKGENKKTYLYISGGLEVKTIKIDL